MKQISESTYNFSVYFGMSSIGTYAEETHKNEDKTTFGFTPYSPCKYVNDTELTLRYLNRRLDTASDFGAIQKFNPCTNGIAVMCEEAYESVYAHFAASLVFALFASPLQFYRASIIRQKDSLLVFSALSLFWVLVFSLMAAGAGEFYTKCVEPTIKFLEEDFAPFDGVFVRGYGPVTNIAISSSFFASMCLLANLFFMYRSSDMGDGGALADKGVDDASGQGPRESSRLSKQVIVTPKKKDPSEGGIYNI